MNFYIAGGKLNVPGKKWFMQSVQGEEEEEEGRGGDKRSLQLDGEETFLTYPNGGIHRITLQGEPDWSWIKCPG